MTVQTVLLTGFAPFDKEPINSSWEVARALNANIVRVPRVLTRAPARARAKAVGSDETVQANVIARQLPCEFDRALEVLGALIKRLKPDLIIGLGQANSRHDFSVERVAININDARIKDNAGKKPIDTSVVQGAPVAYFSGLPIKAIVQAVRKAGIPASVSQSAGTFVCNHSFYGLMHLLATEYPDKRGGFIHLPLLPEQAARTPGTPSLGLDAMVQATRIAIVTTLGVRRDRRLGGGSIA
jgi:pyroglutamyl-peptidase